MAEACGAVMEVSSTAGLQETSRCEAEEFLIILHKQ